MIIELAMEWQSKCEVKLREENESTGESVRIGATGSHIVHGDHKGGRFFEKQKLRKKI